MYKAIGIAIGFLLVMIVTVICSDKIIENQETIITNQETIIKNDSITNARITKFNRANSTDFLHMHRDDYCKTVREHIDKTHTPNHLTCKYLKK